MWVNYLNELKTILDENLFVDKLNKQLGEGGVIAFVTDTVWGIGCLPECEKGVDKIYEIKGRDKSKPLILMSDKKENLFPYIKSVTPEIEEFTQKYFPGALTVIAEKSEKTPDYITSGKNTVGIRVPNNKFFMKLCSVIKGGVLATTSANISNQPSAKSYEEAKASIGDLVDFIFEDYGYKCFGLESTIIIFENTKYKIIREGSLKLK